ncbi:hypothetical protein [Natronococcus sp. JC468]|uniref:hypothetical protein n=1 Tax=Natronococcus sp. JC468 TaxID=1961921 RepID=UPI003743EEB8
MPATRSTARFRTELKDAVRAADTDDDICVLVLTGGEGSGAFVAGAKASIIEQCDGRLISILKVSYQSLVEGLSIVIVRIFFPQIVVVWALSS